jgi:hypothetical protein
MSLNLKYWFNKLQEFDLINKWKGLSLFKKVICVAVMVVVGFLAMLLIAFLVNYFIGGVVLFFWFSALFKPSIVKSNTRMQASKRILIPFISIFLAIGIFYQYYTLEQKPTFLEYVVGSDAEFDEKGNLIKENNPNTLVDRILGNHAEVNDKGDVIKPFRRSIIIYLGFDGYRGSLGVKDSNGQTLREARKGLFSLFSKNGEGNE